MKKVRIIIGIVVLLIVIGVAFFFGMKSRIISKIPSGTIGNTAGNLQNGGMFCESGDKVFFANPYDGNSLYSMNPDESGITKLGNAIVSSINAGGDYIFYYQSQSVSSQSLSNIFRINGVYRARRDGKDTFCIQRVVSPGFSLVDNTIVYQLYDTEGAGSVTLWRTGIDKSDEKQLSDKLVNPCSIINNTIYYAGQDSKRYLYAMDINSGTSRTLYEGDVYNPQAVGDWVYFMDITGDYHIKRYSLSTGDIQEVTAERVDCFNVVGNLVYYQTVGQAPALKRIGVDGSGEELVSYGVYKNINATSRYVYFIAFDNDTQIFHTPVAGPVNVQTFVAPNGL